MAQFLNSPVFQIVGPNGTPYPGAKLYIYETGTTTLLDLYSDEAMETAATNPLVADASGLFSPAYFAETKFKAILKTSTDVTIATADPVYSVGASDAISADNVSFDGSSIGFAAETVQDAIEEITDSYAGLSGADFTGDVTITQTGGGSFLTLESTDAGAGSGPDIELYRNSASPAASDVLGSLLFYGKDSAGNKDLLARISGSVTDPTSASEDVILRIATIVAGTLAERINIGAGLYTQGVTGGDKGAGTVNAGTLYNNNSPVLSAANYASTLVYSGTTQNETDFPIGTILLVEWTGASGAASSRNATVAVYYSASNANRYTNDATGNVALTGTWRARGSVTDAGSGEDALLVQRVA